MLLQIEAFGPSIYEDMPDLGEAGDCTVTAELPLGCYWIAGGAAWTALAA